MAKINTSINDVFSNTPVGPLDAAIGNVFYGINHRQNPTPVPINKDQYGLTFFTRPQLNLSMQNARADRRFIPLLSNEPASIQRIIRSYLDPRLFQQDITCPFVDPSQVFIPLLTNHLTNISGWQDTVVDTFTSKPGAYKEVYSMVDGVSDNYTAYTLTASFRNMTADPITLLFSTWTTYQANVYTGRMMPYPDFIVKNEIDYNTRIYRLVLDHSKTFVQKIACCGAAFPTSVPMSKAFDFQNDVPLNMSNNEIQISFQCIGTLYNDDIIVHAFNKAVQIFNVGMRDEYLGKMMKKIPYAALQFFNGRGYPRINPNSYELEWYVDTAEYTGVMNAFAKYLSATKQTSA